MTKKSSALFVPAVQPIELYFFQRVFCRLCQRKGRVADQQASSLDTLENARSEEDDLMGVRLNEELIDDTDIEEKEVLLIEFQRAMIRLFQVIRDDREFDVRKYDVNGNGKVGWLEFCSLWKEKEGIVVRLSMAERIYLVFEDPERSILGKIMSVLVFITIIVSTGSFIVSTLPEMRSLCPLRGEEGFDDLCKPKPKKVFESIDLACIIFFTSEYGIRLLLSACMRTELVDREMLMDWMVCDEAIAAPRFYQRVFAFVTNWCNLIDLAAIMPWYLSQMITSTEGFGNTIIKIIRLMRVVRAFRLARRFEAVIIMMRSQRKSFRALYVLVLNLCLGMLIFGALMYFAEQGTWNPDTRAWERQGLDGIEKNPFESIPSCFWWAIVTATTVGYGDAHTPRTAWGKAIAGLCMVWSVCVLALPIGVIGGNFIQVWEQYDKEKKIEQENRQREAAMLKKSLAYGDKLHFSRTLLIEVRHDSGVLPAADSHYSAQSEFLGEVECMMTLPPDKDHKDKLTLKVASNPEKARRRVRGQLTFEYSWKPTPSKDPQALLTGSLQVKILKAEGLVNIDWGGAKGCTTGGCDHFCAVMAHPRSPQSDGILEPVVKYTTKVDSAVQPYWDDKGIVEFDFNWTEENGEILKDLGMRQSSRNSRIPRASEATTPTAVQPAGTKAEIEADRCAVGVNGNVEVLKRTLPKLEKDVRELKCLVPQLQKEVAGARSDMQKILHAVHALTGGKQHTQVERIPVQSSRHAPPEHAADAPAGPSPNDSDMTVS